MDFYKTYFLLYYYSSKEISYLASMYFMHILKAKHIFSRSPLILSLC